MYCISIYNHVLYINIYVQVRVLFHVVYTCAKNMLNQYTSSFICVLISVYIYVKKNMSETKKLMQKLMLYLLSLY